MYIDKGNYATAIYYLKEAIDKLEEIRYQIDPKRKKEFFAAAIGAYEDLTSSCIKNKRINEAFQSIEQGRARNLADRLNSKLLKLYKVPSITDIQKNIDGDTAVVIFANSELKDLIQITITKDKFEGKEISIEEILKPFIDNYQVKIDEVIKEKKGFLFEKESGAISHLGRQKKLSDYLEKIIYFYRHLLTFDSLSERGLKLKYNETSKLKEEFDGNARIKCSNLLYKALFSDIQGLIKNKKKLIIIPDGVLSYLPFETLVDENNAYLVETYDICYINSFYILDTLKNRKYKADRKTICAFGGAIYEPEKYNIKKYDNERSLAYLESEILTKTKSNQSVGELYYSIGVEEWVDLPGTKEEVEKIKDLFNDSNIFLGIDVNEKNIKSLSTKGDLKKYKILHFATHGIVISALPDLSAIVLSQVKALKNKDKEDNYLRASEIAKLNINADLVTLSACETGLGKIYGGEGVVGLIQSFIIAGANSVISTLWTVDDKATIDYMTTFYRLKEKEKYSFFNANSEIKRKFIKGEFGEKQKLPYFWAPFIYYGM